MANCYTQFSEVIPCENEEQVEWLMGSLATAVKDEGCESEDSDDDGYPPCEFERDGSGVWVHSEDGGDLEALVNVICSFQEKFSIGDPWSLAWAETCSRPRVGEFGGGAIVVYKGEAEWINTWDWCEEKKKEKVGCPRSSSG